MGYTHYNSISVTGTGGFAVGSATAGETRIIDSSGDTYKPSGTQLSTKEGVMNFYLSGSSTAAQVQWGVAPYDCSVEGYVAWTVSSGTGRVVAVAHGSAGDNALSTGTTGVTGTIGAVVAMTASADTTFSAGEVFRITCTSCATAQPVGITVILTKS